jgi:DNA topoisomerase-1
MPGKNLIIVESPGKISKIKSIMGADYEIGASVGHIKGMDPKKLGFDIENNYEPDFIVLTDKKKVVAELKRMAKGAKEIYFCADADREGEMIAFSVMSELKIPISEAKRASFTEITKKAITNAIAKPGKLNMDLVHAQMARSVLDKLIGYKVSPVLWKQFHNYHLSAGRVQSVVAKLIMERENEILKFASAKFYPLNALFIVNNDKKRTKSNQDMELISKSNTIQLDGVCDTTFPNKEKVLEITSFIQQNKYSFSINSIKESITERKPAPPYITSTLQQDASNKLGMNPETCMRLAQQLYEAGLITYMRTDSVILSDDICKEINEYVISKFGASYSKPTKYSSKSASAQEAHEACRPTHITTFSTSGFDKMTNSHNRLYQMIWKRTVASQMSPAKVNILNIAIIGTTTFKIEEKELLFKTKFENILFDGFLIVYSNSKSKSKDKIDSGEELDEASNSDDNEENDVHNDNQSSSNTISFDEIKNILKKGQTAQCIELQSIEKYTKPPHGRFNEASLIKKLEDLGIGRPATYAKMVGKVQERAYVEIKTVEPKIVEGASIYWKVREEIKETPIEIKLDGDKNKLFPTSLGVMITKFLNTEFSTFMDYKFTANIEELLDKVANGEFIWWKVVDSVYQVIKPTILEITSKSKGGSSVNDNMDAVDDEDGKDGNVNNLISKSQNKRDNCFRLLGNDPVSGNEIKIITTKNGYAISIKNDTTGKYQYASVDVKDLETITLQDALKSLSYPKNLGMYNGDNIIVAKAMNFYLKWNCKNYSIENYLKCKSDESEIKDAKDITFDDAKKVIAFYENQSQTGGAGNEAVKSLKYGEYEIKKGPYGVYIKYQGGNYPLPAKYKKDPESLNETICKEIVDKKKCNTSGDTTRIDETEKDGKQKNTIRGRGRGGFKGRGRGRGQTVIGGASDNSGKGRGRGQGRGNNFRGKAK